MRETSLVLPTFNSEKLILASLQSALRQTVNPYKIVIADEGSSDLTVELAKEIQAHTLSAGLPWFSFDIVFPSQGKSALRKTLEALRSDCVVVCDPSIRLVPTWCGTVSVALYNEPQGGCLYSDGVVAFKARASAFT